MQHASLLRPALRALALAGLSAFAARAQIVIDDPIPAPVFSPVSATFADSLTVVMAAPTPGAAIHYTLDGSTPTVAGPRYEGPIRLSQSTTIKAMAARNTQRSAVVTAVYTRLGGTAAMPVASPPGRPFATSLTVALATSTEGATLYYTLDGSQPNPGSSFRYTGPLVIAQSTTLKAVAVKWDMAASATLSETYTLVVPQPMVAPAILPAGGTFADSLRVAFALPDTGGRILYTLDGTDPTLSSPVYSGEPLLLVRSATVKAMAIQGDRLSAVAVGRFERIAAGVRGGFADRPRGARFHPRRAWEREGRRLDGARR